MHFQAVAEPALASRGQSPSRAGQEMHSHKSGPKGPLVLPRDGLSLGCRPAGLKTKQKRPEFIKVYHQLTV